MGSKADKVRFDVLLGFLSLASLNIEDCSLPPALFTPKRILPEDISR
jgi:hypothetical protein